ncbi:MAG: DUF3368 domain-containing protein [Thermoguttaceae bacterium]|nr:DUF3368 domain-containing protein [Thermoguttaceae bacterium]
MLIPEAVFTELTANKRFNKEAELIKKSKYIKVVKVGAVSQVTLLRRATGLDLGESEAIIYADENKADLLLVDEAAGRRVAQNMNLSIAGSVGILVRAFKDGFIAVEEAEDVFDKIKSSNRHISEKLIDDALDIIHRAANES